ncbi:MAG: M1 family metallopeptidase [Bacteroidota bacterium]
MIRFFGKYPSPLASRAGLLLCYLLFAAAALVAQSDYFQQEVNYTIQVTLDDENHVLHGQLDLEYTNNSPNELTAIYFHLWPRAYGGDNTAFARQQLRDGKTRFHFSSPGERGTMDSLSFQQDGEQLAISYLKDNPDVAKVILAKGLPSGATTSITTPFRVKIPASFSRLGHVETSYQITQWYPKPAVYDQEGWHPMPYLDRGEFYSEFGSFDVSITLPENYLVGATGQLQSATEREWLLEQAAATQAEMSIRADTGSLSNNFVEESFPPSATRRKTLRYRAEKVHDFAWFADKRFKVLHDTLAVPGGPEIDVWSFFTETEAALWHKSIDYLKRATAFYSEHVGAYPYPQVTAVQSALSAGGGMEYPMITVIDQSGTAFYLDQVLAHEVGHNWFYGILGSNERTHAWMDEGINSYYEARYTQQYYGENISRFQVFGRPINADQLGYLYQARQGKDQAPATHSDSLSENNYWMGAYSKPRMALTHLANIVGEAALDEAINEYYESWAFMHPSPASLQYIMERILERDLDWLFQGMMESNQILDLKLKEKGPQLEIVDNGLIPAPATLQVDGEDNTRVTSLPTSLPRQSGATHRLDAGPLDLYPGNNYGQRTTKLQFGILPEQADRQQLFLVPVPGYNIHDGIQAGLALHNRTLEPRPLEWIIAPQFGLQSSQLNGFSGFRWRLPRKLLTTQERIREITVSLGYQTYSHRTFLNETYRYHRFAGNATLHFRHPAIKNVASRLRFRGISLGLDRPDFDSDGQVSGTEQANSTYLSLSYSRRRMHAINPSGWRLALEQGQPGGPLESNFLKISGQLTGGFQYEQGQWIRWRLFGGYFLSNDLRERNFLPNYALSLVSNASTDYRYDELYVGRNDQSPGYDLQTAWEQGGFRVPINSAFSFGRSNDYLATLNLDADIPFFPPTVPIGAYLDAGTYGRSPLATESEATFQWVAGASLTFWEGRLGIYLPLAASPDLKALLDQRDNVLQRLSIRLELSKLLPWRLIDNISL